MTAMGMWMKTLFLLLIIMTGMEMGMVMMGGHKISAVCRILFGHQWVVTVIAEILIYILEPWNYATILITIVTVWMMMGLLLLLITKIMTWMDTVRIGGLKFGVWRLLTQTGQF